MLKKWSTLAALFLATALLLTGCVQGGDACDPNAEPTATLAPLTERMYTDREALYQYYNAVAFEISNATSIDQFAVLNKNYTYAMTCGALGGRAMELAQIAQDTSDSPEIKRLYVWATPKGDVVQVLFSGDEKLESVSYTLAEGE